MYNFLDKLRQATELNDSYVCVGLDSDYNLIPEFLKDSANPIFEFNKRIIDATADLVCAYKPNSAFYESQGKLGLEALELTIEYIPENIPVILDAKRGDIGNTCEQYAISCFEHLKADAITVSPYMGFDSISPFGKYHGTATFVLVKTSNQSAADLQNLELENQQPVYSKVCELLTEWQKSCPAILGAVVGATYPEDLKIIRELLPDAPLLIPGLGAQGGDLVNTILNGLGPNGTAPIIINSSRGIIFASNQEDFAEVSRLKCNEFRNQLNSFRIPFNHL